MLVNTQFYPQQTDLDGMKIWISMVCGPIVDASNSLDNFGPLDRIKNQYI